MKLRYEFPPDKVRKGIRWLEVMEADGGAYLFQYEDLDSPPKCDCFYANIGEALSDCEKGWGLGRSQWHEV
jgi:hypothetical protein